MILLLLECCLRNEHWEVAVLYTELLDFFVEELLDLLPNVIRSWSEDIASRDIIVLNQLCLDDDVGVPLGEVDILLVVD